LNREGLAIVGKHKYLWLAALLFLSSIIVLVFSFSNPAFLLLILSVAAGALFMRALLVETSEASERNAAIADDSSSEEDSFELGKLFEATMSGMREGLLVVDRDMRVIASNVSARSLFDASSTKLESQRLTQITRNPAIYGAFLDALQGKERSGVKVETFAGSRRIFDLRVVPLNKADDTTQGAIGIFFDITRLERLERVRQEFLSNVSHELRTPLTAILAFVETLESVSIDEENRQRFLSIIKKNAGRMNSLIQDILELSAIESGNVKVDAKPTDLAETVNDVYAALAAKAASRRVTLTNTVDPGTNVLADPSRLEQMLTNLVDNAIKFNREGGKVVVRYENNEHSRILVEDTGEGIPAQHVERLFERFYRVDRARSRDLGGTGLGLAIVKHLARAHGGEVAVESRLGEGSVFAIELPKQGDTN
jgi:two-component system, OmpR family, phosphate regulon sensor histidine kinase PhoR